MILTLSFALLVLAAAGFLYRLLVGPDLADRIVGFDGLLAVLVIGILADAVRTGSTAMLPVVLVLTLLAFSSTALLGRFIEAGDDDR
jgi:multisubunit Na+/H+ antiporter MnhF subunit